MVTEYNINIFKEGGMNVEAKSYYKKFSGKDYYNEHFYVEPNLEERIDKEVEKYETLNKLQPVVIREVYL